MCLFRYKHMQKHLLSPVCSQVISVVFSLLVFTTSYIIEKRFGCIYANKIIINEAISYQQLNLNLCISIKSALF